MGRFASAAEHAWTRIGALAMNVLMKGLSLPSIDGSTPKHEGSSRILVEFASRQKIIQSVGVAQVAKGVGLAVDGTVPCIHFSQLS